MNQDELTQKILALLTEPSDDEATTLAGRIMEVVFPSLFIEEEKAPPPALELEEKHVGWLKELLSGAYQMQIGKFADVEESTLYIRPRTYGERRYHMVHLAYDHGLVIEQNDLSEKYQQRVVLEDEEFGPLLRQLIVWYCTKVKPALEESKRSIEEYGDF